MTLGDMPPLFHGPASGLACLGAQRHERFGVALRRRLWGVVTRLPMAVNVRCMSSAWLCLSCLLVEQTVSAVTLWHGTALCEACAREAFTAAEQEATYVVHAPMPATWPRLSRPATG